LLANNRAYERVSKFLSPKHLADPFHGRIFLAIARPIEGGRFADAVTLKAEFEHSGILEEVGGTATSLPLVMIAIYCQCLGSRSRCKWP
jgi:replicative DNA helicase